MKSKSTIRRPARLSALAPGAFKSTVGIAFAATVLFTPVSTLNASSHSDAPLIKQDPQANLTDVYAFVRNRPTGEKVLVVQVSVRPFSEPGDGVMYDAFSSETRYSIHISNPTTGKTALRYDFYFSPVGVVGGNYKNTSTILRYGRGADIAGNPDVGPIQTIGDAHQNFVQNYSVQVVNLQSRRPTARNLNGGLSLVVAPPNVGVNTTPLYNDEDGFAISGAINRAALDPYTNQATYDLPGGTTVFCGPREDGFFADTPAIFDLLDGRILDNNGIAGFGQDGNGVDGFKGYNTLHYSIVIPVSQLPSFTFTGALQPESTGVGVHASVSRRSVTLRRPNNGKLVESGPFVQVNRLGNPLFNEVLVAIADKDLYNRTDPTGDAKLFRKYADSPELAVLLNAVFAQNFQTTNRADLVGIFIPDVIRVNTTTAGIRVAGDSGFNRLSFIGGDTVATNDGTGPAIPSGWPNGRRFGDDVVDIALTALASGPAFSTITVVGDNADTNDQVYNRTFPYAATPHAGPRNIKDSGEND